jgi:hypothetical protein
LTERSSAPITAAWGWPLAPAGEVRDAIVALAVVVGAATLFFLLRNGYVGFLGRYPNSAWVIFAATTVIAALFYRVDYRSIAGPLATIARGCVGAIVVFLIVEPPVLTLANPANADAAYYVDMAWAVAIGLGVLAAWRMPSFAIPAAFYAISVKYLADDISYFYVSTLDIRYVVDSAMFGAGMICVVRVVDCAETWRGLPILSAPYFRDYWLRNRETVVNASAMMAIGFHLGNYFWSGVAKAALDGGVLSWVLENPTHYGLLNALEKGSLPSAAWPWLTDPLYRLLGQGVQLMNATVVAAQLLSIVLVFRIRWLLLLTYFYDLFHLGIYVFGGLFFWPWVWNNLVIVAALRRYQVRPLGPVPKLAAVAGILLGASPQLADAARLAWYDVADVRTSHFEVETVDGSRIRVPLSYFMTHSYGVSHGAFDVGGADRHYDFTLWGSAYRHERLEADGACPMPAGEPTRRDDEARHLERMRTFIRAHHAKMLERAERLGHLNFYYRAHHHPSNPLLYADFNDLDLKTVARYVAVTQSVCLRLEQGRLVRTVRAVSEYPIDVR